MTYDEAVNTILEYYMLGDFPGWTMTDTDCAQMRRLNEERGYEFIQLTKNWDGSAIIHHDFIRLSDYPMEEQQDACSSYYNDLDFSGLEPPIIAECIFEQTYWNVADYGEPRKMLNEYLEIVREVEE